MINKRTNHARVHRIRLVRRDVRHRHIRLAETAFIFADEAVGRRIRSGQRQPSVFVDQLAARQGDFKPIGSGRLARAGDECARRAASIFDIGRHVVLDLDVMPAAEPAECAHTNRHAADPLPQIEIVRRLIEQNAAAVRRPCRAPRTGIVITLRAQPIGDDDAGALDAAQLAGVNQPLHFPISGVGALIEHGAERPATLVRFRV